MATHTHVPKMMVISGEKAALASQDWDDDEEANFNMLKGMIQTRYDAGPKQRFVNDDLWETIAYAIQVIQARIKGGGFDGPVPEGGIGAQEISIRDCIGTRITSTEWDVGWTTAGIRSWLFNHTTGVGNQVIGGNQVTDVFGVHESITLMDTAFDKWGLVYWYVQDLAPAPVVKSIRPYHQKEYIGDIVIEDQIRTTSDKIAELGYVGIALPEKGFSCGVEIRQLGRSALRLGGIIVGTATRLRQTAANVKTLSNSTGS